MVSTEKAIIIDYLKTMSFTFRKCAMQYENQFSADYNWYLLNASLDFYVRHYEEMDRSKRNESHCVLICIVHQIKIF
jgi:hypothetical protein